MRRGRFLGPCLAGCSPPPPLPPRPAFAFLCNEKIIANLGRKAADAGAYNGSIKSESGYGRFLQAINRLSFTPEGEPLRRLVEPYLVRVGTVNPYTIATLM